MEISVHELNNILSEDLPKNFIIIDVRSPLEHREHKITGTLNIPLDQLSKSLDQLKKYQKIFVHCRSGGRGEKACQILKKNFPKKEIYNVKGGILEWEESGFLVEKHQGFHLSLIRQVHILVGFLIVLTNLFGNYLNPNWFLLNGFIGAGLLFAGISGWCGMALLISKMPWNK
jgi:rhodanese-related sulfurtransferase